MEGRFHSSDAVPKTWVGEEPARGKQRSSTWLGKLEGPGPGCSLAVHRYGTEEGQATLGRLDCRSSGGRASLPVCHGRIFPLASPIRVKATAKRRPIQGCGLRNAPGALTGEGLTWRDRAPCQGLHRPESSRQAGRDSGPRLQGPIWPLLPFHQYLVPVACSFCPLRTIWRPVI